MGTAAVWLVLITFATAQDKTSPPASVLQPVGKGWIPLFNGKDLDGWKGWVHFKYRGETPLRLSARQKTADERMREGWKVEDGILVQGDRAQNLVTVKEYGDFELLVDWKAPDTGHYDSGIYLRGCPQVGIGASCTGGLQNNRKNVNRPLAKAENRRGEWNTFYIRIVGDRVTVWTNGKLTVDDVVMENHWKPEEGLPTVGPIELQVHSARMYWRNIYIREITRREGKPTN
jgi:hypothetical protein